MSTPGVSLFQGTESIKVNNSFERAAEEEELEDKKRRDAEIQQILMNGFSDLEDDEATVDSTSNFQSGLIDHPEQRQQQQNSFHVQQEHLAVGTVEKWNAEIQKLKLLLESRSRELETVKQVANDELKKRDEFQKRLAIAEAELDRALASKNNTHELLVECKEKCSNLENTITKLKNDKKSMEAEKNALLGKLETSQSLLSEIQRKYDMVERDLNRHNERNAEIKRKHIEERHRAEIEMMQQQIDQMADKLEKKSSELENMNTRYKALQSSHETMLLDKATKINDLNNALCDAQRRCEELLSKEDYFQENLRLQKLVASLQDQIQGMERTIATLTERLQLTTTELDVMDTVLHQHNLEDSPRRLSQTRGRVVGSTPLNTVDRVGNLKEELYRALANVKSKREEIRCLQRTLEEKQNEIKHLKEEENKALVQISTLNEEKFRLENRFKLLESEFEELRNKSLNKSVQTNKIESLTKQMHQLQQQKSSLEEQRSELEKKKITYELECKKLNTNLRNIEVDFEELKQEHESMKRNYEQLEKENQNLRDSSTADNLRLELEKHKFLLKDAQTECDRLKNLYVDISNAKEALSLDLEKLRSADTSKQLFEERDKVRNLQKALELAELKSSELTKILEATKASYEREIAALKEKLEKERSNLKEAKDLSNNCKKCTEHLAEVTKLEIESLKLKNEISCNKKEIDDLVQQLDEAKSVIGDLSGKLQLCDQQEKLIKELKAKAQQFEDYVKRHSSSSDKSLSPAKSKKHSNPAKSDRSVTTSPELEKRSIRTIEARIRDEMAKIFAVEIKRFQAKLCQTEEQHAALLTQYKRIHSELSERQTEVDLLKQAILAERDAVAEMLKQKEDEFKDALQKQKNIVLQKSRDELQEKNKKIASLTKEMEERQAQIEAERKSMKAVMSQWEEQRKDVDTIEDEWKEKMQNLKKIHESAILSWESQYNSAKRTAASYKRYAEDKEAHFLKELNRVKSEHELALAKFAAQCKEKLEKKDKEMKDAIAALKRNFRESIHDKENKKSN